MKSPFSPMIPFSALVDKILPKIDISPKAESTLLNAFSSSWVSDPKAIEIFKILE